MFVGTILLNWYGHTLQAMPLLPNTSLLALRNFYGIASLLFCPKGRQVVQAWWFHSHTSGRYAANLDAIDFSGEIPQTAAPSGRGWFQCPEQFANSAFARAVTGNRCFKQKSCSACRTSRSRSRKTRLLQYSSWVRKATCRQELFCKRRHSAHEASEVIPAKRRRQDRAGRKQSRQGRRRKQERAGKKQSRKGRTHRSRSSQLEDQVRYQKPRRKLQLWTHHQVRWQWQKQKFLKTYHQVRDEEQKLKKKMWRWMYLKKNLKKKLHKRIHKMHLCATEEAPDFGDADLDDVSETSSTRMQRANLLMNSDVLQ